MRKLRAARPLRSCWVLAGLACATILSVTSFAQQGSPLNFGDNFFVTGDYIVAGARGMTTTFSNGYAIGTFSMPDANPGIHGIKSVPAGAEVVGALVYWQTVENAGTVPGHPGTGENGFFRPLISGGPAAPGYAITGVPLAGQNNVAWSSGGCSEPQGGKITRTYRANVLGAFPQDAKGNVLTNGQFEIRLPSVGPQTPLTLGATLVIIYRVLSPNVPLSSIVIYDGAFGQTEDSLVMRQTVQGFYDASPSPVSKLTLIAGAGKSNKFETVYLDNVALPSHSGAGLPQFPGYYGTWDNPTWTFGDPAFPEIANPVLVDASSATTQVVPTANNPGCVSWGAVIFKTTVNEPDGDGLLKSWKKAGGYCDASINGGVCLQGFNLDPGWVALPGATQGEKDLFIQLDYMCSKTTGIDSCATGDGTNYSFDPRLSGAAALMTQSFLAHGVHVHINPPGTIQPVHAIQEQTCADVKSPQLALCPFSNQAGVVGWKGGYSYFKNQLVEFSNGNVLNCLAEDPAFDCLPRFQHGRKDSWHYALFAHAVGRTEWKIQDSTLTGVVQSGHTVTFTTSAPLGTLNNAGYNNHSTILKDPYCANGRVSVYYAATNTNLNGTFCISSSSAPGGNTFSITVPGPSVNAAYTLFTDPYFSVAPGQTSSASGISDVGGADSLITLGLWGDPTSSSSNGRIENTIAGTFMHETGHSLGLTHGGFYYDTAGGYVPTIEPNCKPNFQSVMNYFFQVDLLNGNLNYSEQQLDSLNEASLPVGVTYKSANPDYPSTKWYTPIQPNNTGSPVTTHCDGTPANSSAYLVPGPADPASPGWGTNGPQDVDFDGSNPSNAPPLRGYSDWVSTPNTTGIDLRQIGATGNSSVFSQSNFFGGGQPLNGGGQPLNGGGQPLNGGGQPLNGGGQPLNGGGQPLNGGGQPLNGGGEINQQTADSYTRTPTNVMASEGVSPRTITLTWTASSFGQIGAYKIYRKPSPNAPNGFGVIATVSGVNGNPPVTTYTDTTVTCAPTGYQYFVTAVLSNTSTNPGQESVPSNVVSTIPPSQNPLTGCYALNGNSDAVSVTGFASPASNATFTQGDTIPIAIPVTDDFYPTNGTVRVAANKTLVAIGPLPNDGNCPSLTSVPVFLNFQGAYPQPYTVLSSGGAGLTDTNNQFMFNWNTASVNAGCYVFEADFDSGQVDRTEVQLQIYVSDSAPHVTTTTLPNGVVGSAYSNALFEAGGVAGFTWSVVSPGTGTLPSGISLNPGSGTLTGTTCVAGSYTFTAKVTDSKMNFGTQALTLQIQRADTITSVVSNATPSVFGQTVKFTVTVAPNLACTPTGTVTLLDGGNPIASNLPLSGGMATFSTSALSVGNHSITASYSGDHNFNATGSDAGSTATTLTQTVNKADTATSVTSSTNPSTYGQPVLVVFTATVSAVQPGAGTPTGMVTFEDGGVALTGFSTVGLTGGMATFSTTSTQLVAGTHSITAVYNGDIDFNFTGFDPSSTATALMQVVNKADTTTSVSPSMNSSIYGQAVTFTATVTPQYSGTPGGSVTFK